MALSASPGKRYGVMAVLPSGYPSYGYGSNLRVATERSVTEVAKQLGSTSGPVNVAFTIIERPQRQKPGARA